VVSVPEQFPVDLPDAPAEPDHAFGWTAIILCIATLSLGLTNAASIDSWGADLPPSPLVARFVDSADRWRETTDRAGLGAARAAMHLVWKKMEKARWPGQRSAGPD
jgi:hypothetical protein